MNKPQLPLLLTCALMLSGCATTPPYVATLEERLTSEYAQNNHLGRNWQELMPYHVELAYAHAAWLDLNAPELPVISGLDTSSTLELPFAIADYMAYGTGPALAGFVLSFGTGTPQQQRKRRAVSRGINLIAVPNTHYFVFDSRPGQATPEDVDAAWKEAHTVFQAIHNRSGRCSVARWTAEHGYARVEAKNIRGVLKRVEFYCPHPLFGEPDDFFVPGVFLTPDLARRTLLVTVEAWANPFEDLRAMGAVQSQCMPYRPPEGEVFADTRDCGARLAARQRPWLPEIKLAVLELITTPAAEDPARFEVLGLVGTRITRLPSRPVTDQYVEFLSSRPYTVEE